jgi:hypothetical protein
MLHSLHKKCCRTRSFRTRRTQCGNRLVVAAVYWLLFVICFRYLRSSGSPIDNRLSCVTRITIYYCKINTKHCVSRIQFFRSAVVWFLVSFVRLNTLLLLNSLIPNGHYKLDVRPLFFFSSKTYFS